MVRVTGLEPARGCHQNLNLARLPIPPHPHTIELSFYFYSRGTLAVPKTDGRSCSSLSVLTAAPLTARFICRRQRSHLMLPIPPHPHTIKLSFYFYSRGTLAVPKTVARKQRCRSKIISYYELFYHSNPKLSNLEIKN